MTIDVDPLRLVDPALYQRDGSPHELWTRLRSEAPVAYFEPAGYPPFWAVTKHADLVEVATQPLKFSSAKGITLDRNAEAVTKAVAGLEMIVFLDPPRHGPMRQVANREFLRSAVRARFDDIGHIAAQIVDEAATAGAVAECDFVSSFAGRLPLEVIAWVLGVPPGDWQRLLEATDTIIGKEDPEFRRPGESSGDAQRRAQIDMHTYFDRLVEDRRHSPQNDLVSLLAQSEVAGEPLRHDQIIGYCELLVEAGNETTRDAIAGAMHSFCAHPDQWELLRQRPELLSDAVEEILRWVTPINYFVRTATEDYELRGQVIRAGTKSCSFGAPEIATRTCSTIPSSFASGGSRTSTSCSASVPISAWGRTWLGPKSKPCFASCRPGWSGSSKPGRSNVCTPQSTERSSICPFATGSPRGSWPHGLPRGLRHSATAWGAGCPERPSAAARATGHRDLG